MDQIKSHRDLIAWQKAMELVVAVYKLSQKFPKEELYGLTSQLRRAAVSIPANIAEGQGRRSKTEFKQFLGHARGSLLELDTHLELALRFNYLDSKEHALVQEQLREVGRIMNGLLRSLTSDL
ncbi:MAG TPA: four helix bundle protein [Pyrinomonadaceae bacterium]|nr:four helix bundle protein [Pyrinomonadaceae bacterium]